LSNDLVQINYSLLTPDVNASNNLHALPAFLKIDEEMKGFLLYLRIQSLKIQQKKKIKWEKNWEMSNRHFCMKLS